MPFTRKRIRLLAISPERGVAYAKYGDSAIFSIGPLSFRPKRVQNWSAVESRLGDFSQEEELADFKSSFNSWDELAKYLQQLFVESNQALLPG